MRITFAGAAETVTGSCHLIETAGARIVLDCGLFQGKREIRSWNRRDFPFDPASVDAVLLSHAHLDHTGRLPLLVKRGFSGPIIATRPTRDLAELIMRDSAHIQKRDEQWARKKGRDAERWRALYSDDDVNHTLSLFKTGVRYTEPIDVVPGVTATFRDAGHIVGSSFIELTSKQNGSQKRLTFSGDLGNINKPVVQNPKSREAGADVILMESTYGDRNHKPFADTIRELRKIVLETFERGGTVVIPAFALERSQEILVVLFNMANEGLLGGAPIFLDSPMAISVTKAFTRHPEAYDEELLGILKSGKNPFSFSNLHFTPSVAESKRINTHKGPGIIISASGMCTAGRILHHLKFRLPNANNSVVFIGYQAFGTLGRKIVDGEQVVKIHGEVVKVRAAMHTVNGFSGHAGRDTLLEWLGSAGLPDRLFLVHGEKGPIDKLAREIRSRYGIKGIDPGYKQRVQI
jgi:metallo-beta-lactamase family protein